MTDCIERNSSDTLMPDENSDADKTNGLIWKLLNFLLRSPRTLIREIRAKYKLEIYAKWILNHILFLKVTSNNDPKDVNVFNLKWISLVHIIINLQWYYTDNFKQDMFCLKMVINSVKRHPHGEELLHGGWSSYDNLFRSSCDNCHRVRRKTFVYTKKTIVKNGYFQLSKISFRC
jgi:hypothetical protein